MQSWVPVPNYKPQSSRGITKKPQLRKTSSSNSPSPRKRLQPPAPVLLSRLTSAPEVLAATPYLQRPSISAAPFDSAPQACSAPLAPTTPITTLDDAINYVQASLFVPLPLSGLGSVRRTSIHDFRETIPPITNVSHIHQLLDSPTAVAKEIAELQASGDVHAIYVPARGNGRSTVGHGSHLIRTAEWVERVQDCVGLEQEARDKLCREIQRNGRATLCEARRELTEAETTALVHAGFLTVAPSNLLAEEKSTGASRALLDRSAFGTAASLAASRGASSLSTSRGIPLADHPTHLLTLPYLNRYANLVHAALEHLLSLFTNARTMQLVLHELKEKWNGGGGVGRSVTRERKGAVAVIPLYKQTRWKELFGINFEFVLREAMGRGLVEAFETGSVGWGLRRTGREL